MSDQRPRTKPRKRRSRKWHRILGLILFLPLLFVSITGIILNHTEDLGLDEKRVTAGWILDRYGMEPEGEPVTFRLSPEKSFSTWGGSLFLDGTFLDHTTGKVVGVVRLADELAVVSERGILLLSLEDGSLIERIGEESLPPDLPLAKAMAGEEQRLVVEGGSGKRHLFSADFLEHEATEVEGEWSVTEPTDEALIAKMRVAQRGEGLPLSRVLLDMHSGKFFGTVGKWIADIMVVLIVILSLTGLRLFFRKTRAEKS